MEYDDSSLEFFYILVLTAKSHVNIMTFSMTQADSVFLNVKGPRMLEYKYIMHITLCQMMFSVS